MYKSFPNIIEAKPLENYQIYLKFDDGICGNVDLLHLKGRGVFKYWDNYENFKNFEIIYNALTWNEDLDMDTTAFYLMITNQTFEEYARN